MTVMGNTSFVPDPELHLSIREAAEYLDRCRQRVYTLLKEGRLTIAGRSRGRVYITRSSLDRYREKPTAPRARRGLLGVASDRLPLDQRQARRWGVKFTKFDRATELLWGRSFSDEMYNRVHRPGFLGDAGNVKRRLNDELKDVLLPPETAEACSEVLACLFKKSS